MLRDMVYAGVVVSLLMTAVILAACTAIPPQDPNGNRVRDWSDFNEVDAANASDEILQKGKENDTEERATQR